jgi:prepilin-type N-terminal cleavage/methylation domain-containing protein
MLNKILSKKIKFPLSLRMFPFCHSRESGNPSHLSLQGAFPHVIARERSDRSNLNNSGFSLIELMVAAVILSLAIFGIFQAYSTGFLGMFDARDRTVATNYVQEKMEELENADFDTVVGEASSQIFGDIKFSRNVNVEYIDGSTNLIATEPTNLKRVITTVNWTDRNGVTKKVENSVLLQNTQFTPGDAARISLYANPYNVVLPVNDSTTIIAVIKDKQGNTVIDWDGSDITFTIISEVSPEGESLEGLLGTLSDYAVTPMKGQASVVFTSSMAKLEGTVIVEASVTTSDASNTFTDTIDIRITLGAVKIELTPNPSSIYADGEDESIITAIIQNAAGEKIEGGEYDITFIVTGEGTLIGSNPVTSSLGKATITLQSTITAGIANVTATSPNLLSDSCDVQTSGEPVGIILSASPNPIYSDDTSEVTVTILDENGVPVIPAPGSVEITLNTLDGNLTGITPLTFDGVSSQSMMFTPSIAEGLATIWTIGTYEESVEISIMQELIPHHIDLNANPPNIPYVDGISTITATIKDEDGITVHNYNGDVTFSMLSGFDQNDNPLVFGILNDPDEIQDGKVTCSNGVATIELESGGENGTCRVKAENFLLPSTSTTIDVGFYTTATHILLTATRENIPVGGGNEGTSKLTASIVDVDNIIVYNYNGDVLFEFLSGYNENDLLGNAKFEFVDNFKYSVPIFNGIASVDLISLSNAGVATLKASSVGLLDSGILTIYIKKTLKLAVFPNITYFTAGKNVSFDIEVRGGDITIDRMRVTWSPPDSLELTNVTIDADGNISNNSEGMLNGSDFDIVPINLLEGITPLINRVTLTFDSSIEDKDISIIFYPAAGESYCEDSYEINL